MNKKTIPFLCSCTALFLSIILLEPVCFAVNVEEAGAMLDQTEQDLSLVYSIVSSAAEAGADVAALVERLSVAGNYLSVAHSAYRTGNYDTALFNAEACRNALQGVADDAIKLRAAAKNARSENILYVLVASFTGLAMLCLLGLLGWRYLSTRYFKRVPHTTPMTDDHQ